mgnify:CR=1 FL=1
MNGSFLFPYGCAPISTISNFKDLSNFFFIVSVIFDSFNFLQPISNKDDSAMMIFEFKKDQITEKSVRQTEHYLDLLSVIFPDKKIFANVIGIGLETDNINTSSRFADNIKLVNLKVLNQYRKIFNKSVILGLSDHTFGHNSVLGAVTL